MPPEPESALHPRKSAAKSRGGRRPGAGAPKGNLNALKHGLRSRQFAQAGAILAANPKLRETLIRLGYRHQLKQDRADEVAVALFTRLFQHARDIAAGKPSRGPFAELRRPVPPARCSASQAQGLNAQSTIDERRSIEEIARQTASFNYADVEKFKNRTPVDQN